MGPAEGMSSHTLLYKLNETKFTASAVLLGFSGQVLQKRRSTVAAEV